MKAIINAMKAIIDFLNIWKKPVHLVTDEDLYGVKGFIRYFAWPMTLLIGIFSLLLWIDSIIYG